MKSALCVLLALAPVGVWAAPKKPVAKPKTARIAPRKAPLVRWEYKLVSEGGDTDALEDLNRLGAQGWEVVGYASDRTIKSWTLKRRK